MILLRQNIEEKIWQLIQIYCVEKDLPILWRKPIVKFADATHPGFLQLRQIVDSEHHLPSDYLKTATNVLSWFLPFRPEVGKNNLVGALCSEQWADAYLITNEMAAWINEQLVCYIRKELGADAAVAADAGMISMEKPRSRWSQRHVAYLAGHGTFGKNNMLISDVGAVGRYFSVITTLNVAVDKPVAGERCLWKKNGSCGACMKRCEVGALTPEGFDRFKCLQQCLINMHRYPGADVCGKCTVELPCSYEIPKSMKE